MNHKGGTIVNTMLNIFVTIVMDVSGGAMPIAKEIHPTEQYTVSFESNQGYPVSASLTFANRGEAEAFARNRAENGYSVHIMKGN